MEQVHVWGQNMQLAANWHQTHFEYLQIRCTVSGEEIVDLQDIKLGEFFEKEKPLSWLAKAGGMIGGKLFAFKVFSQWLFVL